MDFKTWSGRRKKEKGKEFKIMIRIYIYIYRINVRGMWKVGGNQIGFSDVCVRL